MQALPKGSGMNAGRTVGARRTIMAGIILLAVAAALIHLYLGFQQGLPLFVLNGPGYLALVAALYPPLPQLARYRTATRRVLLGYTLLTIVLWIVVGERAFLDRTDEIIEAALAAFLIPELARARSGR